MTWMRSSAFIVECMVDLAFGQPGDNIKMSHHAGRMMFKDMAVIHPSPRPVIHQPGYSYHTSSGDIHRILPGRYLGGNTVDGEDLKEKTVQMKGVIQFTWIFDFPDL